MFSGVLETYKLNVWTRRSCCLSIFVLMRFHLETRAFTSSLKGKENDLGIAALHRLRGTPAPWTTENSSHTTGAFEFGTVAGKLYTKAENLVKCLNWRGSGYHTGQCDQDTAIAVCYSSFDGSELCWKYHWRPPCSYQSF